jgi:UDP-glucose:(glucosyl)LPS alpha-1,2-glucosyltransferase
LELLVPVFTKMAENDPKIHLHVHSSFKIYGWEERDKPFEPIYKICREHPQITYHGFTEYQELKEKIKGYHILAYPCIWPETACRVVIEAMSAGLACVHSNLGALPDTTGCLNYMYDGSSIPEEHYKQFYTYLVRAIQDVRGQGDEFKNHLIFNKTFIDRRFDPKLFQLRWTNMLQELVDRYPTIESRGVQQPKNEFVYKIGP